MKTPCSAKLAGFGIGSAASFLAVLAPALAATPAGSIAFTYTKSAITGSNPDICTVNADGTGFKRLTTSTASDRTPSISPDGSKIAFSSDRDGNFEIYLMNADGSGQTRLTNAAGDDFNPKWSPDGKKITFTSFRTGGGDVYVMNASPESAGNVPLRCTSSSAPEGDSIFSKDGSSLFFVRGGYDSVGALWGDLWTVKADGSGSGLTRITFADQNDNDVETKDTLAYSPALISSGTRVMLSVDVGIKPDDASDSSYIVSVASTGGDTEQDIIMDGSSWDAAPSPDGANLVYVHANGTTDVLARAQINGTGSTTIYSDGVCEDPFWGPAPPVAAKHTLTGRVVRWINSNGVYTKSGVKSAIVKVGSATFTTGDDGFYSFPNLADGTYTVSVSKDGTSFDPPTQTIKIAGADVVAPPFKTYGIAGRVFRVKADGTRVGLANVPIRIDGIDKAVTDVNGNYAFGAMGAGTFRVRPFLDGWNFVAQNVTLPTSGVTNYSPWAKTNFQGTKAAAGAPSPSGDSF